MRTQGKWIKNGEIPTLGWRKAHGFWKSTTQEKGITQTHLWEGNDGNTTCIEEFLEDALSRKDEDVEAFLYVILIIQPNWIIEARDEWKNDEKVWTLIQRLQQDSSTSDTFTWKNDSLWCKDRLYLCKNSKLKQKVVLELHTSPVGGHLGFKKILLDSMVGFQKYRVPSYWRGVQFQ